MRRARRRHAQDAARRLSRCRERLRPSGDQRHVLRRRLSRDLRSALPLRLFRAPGRAAAQHGRRLAASRRRRTHVYDQGEARHPFRSRSRVQRQAARVDGRRLRLQHQARVRPEGTFVLAVPVRGQPRRARCAARTCAQERPLRLRRNDRGRAGARSLYAAHPLQEARLRVQVVAHDVELRRRRARSRRENIRTRRTA